MMQASPHFGQMPLNLNLIGSAPTRSISMNDTASVYDPLSEPSSPLGTSPVTPLMGSFSTMLRTNMTACNPTVGADTHVHGNVHAMEPAIIDYPQGQRTYRTPSSACATTLLLPPKAPKAPAPVSYTHVSLQTLVGCSEILGHTLEDRSSVSSLQDPHLAAVMQCMSTTQVRGLMDGGLGG